MAPPLHLSGNILTDLWRAVQPVSASPRTIKRWATKLRHGPWKRSAPRKRGGRPPTPAQIVELVLTLKRENPDWGQKKLSPTLRRVGIRVSASTVEKILEANGFGPPGGDRTWEAYTSAAKDALWALDFFVVRTLHGRLLQVMAVIDVCTQELLDLRAYDGWEVDSAWTMRTLAAALSSLESKPNLPRSSYGNVTTHWRRGTPGGMTRSAAPLSAPTPAWAR